MLRKAPPRRPLPRVSRIIFILVALMVTLEGAAFATGYLTVTRHYVSTNNAQVDGDQIRINAPTTGTVTRWNLSPGQTVSRNEVVGRIQLPGGGPEPARPVRSPADGTIAVNDVVDGTYVTAGTELAIGYDPSTTYVTARIADTEVGDVHPGALVDIKVDAYPQAAVTGIVSSVQDAAASTFSVLPPPGSADPSNPRRVDQYVPVRITLTNTAGKPLAPGLNVTAHIHKPAAAS